MNGDSQRFHGCLSSLKIFLESKLFIQFPEPFHMHMDGEKSSLRTVFVTTQLSLGILRVCGVLSLIFSWLSKRGDFLMLKLLKLLRLLAVF